MSTNLIKEFVSKETWLNYCDISINHFLACIEENQKIISSLYNKEFNKTNTELLYKLIDDFHKEISSFEKKIITLLLDSVEYFTFERSCEILKKLHLPFYIETNEQNYYNVSFSKYMLHKEWFPTNVLAMKDFLNQKYINHS